MTDLRFFLELPIVITNDKGRELWFDRLNQRRTYIDFLQVYPTPEVNAGVIGRAREEADEFGHGSTPVFLIEPEPIAWGREFPEGARDDLLSRRMKLERLPVVTCMADLRSDEIVGKEGCCSSLTVVWFQDTLAMPIDPSVLERLKAIDWDERAQSYDP